MTDLRQMSDNEQLIVKLLWMGIEIEIEMEFWRADSTYNLMGHHHQITFNHEGVYYLPTYPLLSYYRPTMTYYF